MQMEELQRAQDEQSAMQNYFGTDPRYAGMPLSIAQLAFEADMATRKEDAKRSGIWKQVRDMGLDPNSPEGQSMMKQLALRPSTQITMPPSPADVQKQVLGFHAEVKAVEAPFRVALDGMNMIQALAQNPSGVSDQALIAAFAKIIDPGSVVRESEAAAIQNTSGLLAQLGVKLNQIMEGEKLTPKQRADIVRVAGQRFKGAERRFLQDRARLNQMASTFQIGNISTFAEDLGPGYKPLEVPTLENQPAKLGPSWNEDAERIFQNSRQGKTGGF